ncbi:hypothetical protein K431DRAFT_297554 [Polychaeton citri CBS 116435]|uniref:Uncharacterized protein n=1 Tax=Polychaeton citri CBS 116435 TaxID=1314669 RepID=A0A9P4Q3P3_9PEZI|nr:hypothetical protein K431DRAFT_297554 [Polychaeton citri CBS 116435]
MYKYIWCPTNALPQDCQWRGSGSCHGQCHVGEVTLAHSAHGSTKCLKPGQQAFCCVSNEWASLTDKCAWSNGCDSCPADSNYAVSSRKIKKGLFSSCTQSFCCPYDFQNCHWIGKGTCDDNECSGTDVQVGLDPTGDTSSACAAGLNGRLKPLCCNTPENLSPFLPVPLENLFPTLPPSGDIPAFDDQILSQLPSLVGANPNNGAFFFVVIDGPPDAVTNLNKSDGSHLEFLTGPVHHGQTSQTAHFICMDDSPSSNCDDMYLNGLNGTIIRLPDHLGFAQWAVAHDVRPANYSAPRHFLKRIPPKSRVLELEYSYDFSRVKRAPGPIFMRVDYSSSNTYYTEVVEAAHQKKRDLEPRFWSTVVSIWEKLFQNIRTEQVDSMYQPSIEKDNFNVLIYGDDGSNKGCNGADGFLRLNLAGSMRSVMRFGVTLVGTIQPYNMEEAYGFFDSDLYMSGQLDFDGKGTIDINGGNGAERNLFSSPISNYQASHPGIVSFSPELNAAISLVGKGEIDGQFSVNFETGSLKTITTNAPHSMSDFGGDILANTFNNAAEGYIAVANTTYNTVFGFNFDLQTTMGVQVYQYGESEQQAGAKFTARTPHAIRVVGNDGSGKPSILDVPQQGAAEVLQDGDPIQDGWDDGASTGIGSPQNPAVILTGGEEPPNPRKAPQINGYAVFGEHEFVTCSSASFTGHPHVFLQHYCQRLVARRAGSAVQAPVDAQARASRAPNARGNSLVQSPARNVNNPLGDFTQFVTPTYPNGNNGDNLDNESGRVTRTAKTARFTVNGQQGVNYEEVNAEHPRDCSITPNSMINEYFQTGTMDLEDGQGTIFRSQYTSIDFDVIFDYMATGYRVWVPENVEENPPPGSLFYDLADALGSSSNPGVMSNLEYNLNILKGRLYTRQGDPSSNTAFGNQMDYPGQGTAEAALSNLNAVLGVFNYMNAINADRQTVVDAQVAAAQTWDNLYARSFPGRQSNAANLVREFWTQWDRRLLNFTRRYITGRLNQMDNVYRPLANGPQSLEQEVLDIIERMRNRITTEIVLP